jgi:hypothetical protein
LILWQLSHVEHAIAETTAEYLPLTDGNSWTFSVTSTTYGAYNETTTVLQGTTPINGVQTKALKTSGGPYQGEIEYRTNDANGIRLHGAYLPDAGDGAGPTLLTFVPPVIAANSIMDIGETVNSSGEAAFVTENYGEFTLNYESSNTIAGIETVTVPAGSYQAIKITNYFRLYGSIFGDPYEDISTETTWLAKNIGPIKNTYSDSDGNEVSVLIATNVRPPLKFLPFLPLLLDD